MPGRGGPPLQRRRQQSELGEQRVVNPDPPLDDTAASSAAHSAVSSSSSSCVNCVLTRTLLPEPQHRIPACCYYTSTYWRPVDGAAAPRRALSPRSAYRSCSWSLSGDTSGALHRPPPLHRSGRRAASAIAISHCRRVDAALTDLGSCGYLPLRPRKAGRPYSGRTRVGAARPAGTGGSLGLCETTTRGPGTPRSSH